MTLVILFIFGLCIGSFLNVVADRLVSGESILWGRSHCDVCMHALGAWDLIPVVSFLGLRGRCRYCKKSLSWQYPLSEVVTGSCFALATPLFSTIVDTYVLTFTSVFVLTVISACIVTVFADIRYRIIPDEMVIILSVVSLSYALAIDPSSLWMRVAAGIVHFAFFLLLVIITKGKGMGMGDVKFAFAMGMVLGFPLIILAFYLSFLTGASVSLILMVTGGKRLKSTIAFGPFLAGATICTLLYGNELWEMSMRVMGL